MRIARGITLGLIGTLLVLMFVPVPPGSFCFFPKSDSDLIQIAQDYALDGAISAGDLFAVGMTESELQTLANEGKLCGMKYPKEIVLTYPEISCGVIGKKNNDVATIIRGISYTMTQCGEVIQSYSYDENQ